MTSDESAGEITVSEVFCLQLTQMVSGSASAAHRPGDLLGQLSIINGGCSGGCL